MEVSTHRYHWKREGFRYVIRAGIGTRPLFRVWRERTAIILCTELLGAFLDGDFARREKVLLGEPLDTRKMNRELCAKEGHVLGVLARPCLRCHEWFDPAYGLPRQRDAEKCQHDRFKDLCTLKWLGSTPDVRVNTHRFRCDVCGSLFDLAIGEAQARHQFSASQHIPEKS